MNFSAAWSSSAVVTPAPALRRAACRGSAATMSPAAAIVSISLRRLPDDHDASSDRSSKRSAASVARIWSPTSSGAARAVDPAQDALLLVVADQRRGLLVVLLRAAAARPRAGRRRVITSRLPSMSQRSGCLGGSKSTWKLCWSLTHTRRPDRRRMTSSSGTSISRAAVERAAELARAPRRAPPPAARCAGSRRG